MKNIYLFYAMPRSGSTPIAKVLGHYLRVANGVTYLEEYFNTQFLGAKFRDGKFVVDPDDWSGPIRADLTFPKIVRHSQQRLDNLLSGVSKSGGLYSLKMFSIEEAFLENQYSKLESRSKVIFISRKNVFDHALSFLLSWSTQQWYRPGGLGFEEKSIKATEADFGKYLTYREMFLRRVRTHPRPRIVYYEDFLKDGPAGVIRSAGFKKEIDWTGLPMTERQNPEDKLALFANPDQILRWYRNSSLNQAFRI